MFPNSVGFGVPARIVLAASVAIAVALPFGASADTLLPRPAVELTSHDGRIVLAGELVSFEGGYYTVAIEGMGLVAVDSTRVRCAGPGCPDTEDL